MRRIMLSELRPSMRIGKTLHDANGQVLLAKGVQLTERFVVALGLRGFSAVYVEDGYGDEIIPADLINERVRAVVSSHVSNLFALAADQPADEQDAAPRRANDWPGETLRLVETLYRDVDAIIDEIMETEAFEGMAALKSHDTYTFDHSVETAIIGVMLGKRLALQRDDLRQLGLGCLLHDVGKRLIPLTILNKPAGLSAEEYRHIQEHPRTGYVLVESLELDSTVPKHIAWQHHERQDGGGYPRRLKGTNRVVRSFADLAAPNRIMLLAELTATADIYSALSSDRPYRAAMQPDRVMSLMHSMAGPHLNREVVDAFFRVVPTYPVGLRVVLSGGQFDGYHGVVAQVRPSSLHRPIVRLLLDAKGRPALHDDVDLRKYPDTLLTSERVAHGVAV